MNLGRVNVFDGLQMTNNLGIIYPVISVAGSSAFYNSTNNDNNNIHMNYPTNTQVTINLLTFAGANMANMPNYVVIFTMIGIEE